MASLSAVEIHGLSNVCGTEAANLIASAVAASAVPGVFDSVNGATQIGSNTTDIDTIVGLLRQQASNAVTAHAGGTQAAAIALTGNLNRLSVVATAADSAKLPAAAAGSTILVINDGAASAQIFGAGTDTINSIATATGVPLPAGAVGIFFATATGNWRGTMISAPISANTAISTAGAGTLTAAGIVGGFITRTGPIAAYSDATDTAVAIVAAFPMVKAGMTFEFVVKNTVPFAETITAGAGVTLTGQTIIPPNSVGRFRVTITSVTAVAIQGIHVGPMTTGPLLATSTLTTNGAGTLLAASIVGGEVTRSGNTAAATDTTDTGTAINSALPNGNVGQSWEFTYVNSTAFLITLANGAGVTVTGLLVPPNSWARYLVTLTAANTVTMVQIASGPNVAFGSPAKFSTINVTTGTLAAGNASGAPFTNLISTNATPGSQAMRTPAQILADTPGLAIGMSYMLRILNTGAGVFTLATDSGTGFTMTGTMTIAQNTWRDFVVTISTATTGIVQQMGIGTSS